MEQLYTELDSGDDDPLVLTGPAGSGKTWLVGKFITGLKGWGVEYMATTGKAALRLSQSTGQQASTIHAKLYRGVTENKDGRPVFLDPYKKELGEGRTLFVCDEASMLDESVYGDLVRAMGPLSRLFFVGDRDQLGPVGGTWGVDFDHPTAVLTEIHRQAEGNPIIRISRDVRLGGKLPEGAVDTAYWRGPGKVSQMSEWLASKISSREDATILAWTNDTRHRVNRKVREYLRFPKDRPIVVGDRLVCCLNNKRLGVMNGSLFLVESVREETLPTLAKDYEIKEQPVLKITWHEGDDLLEAFVDPATIGADYKTFKASVNRFFVPMSAFLFVDHGYALTVHKAQGSQWETVAFLIDRATWCLAARDPDDARRLVYTAVTRASKRLAVVDLE